MISYLKRGKSVEERADDDAKVRQSVEAILADIEARGDASDAAELVTGTSILIDGAWTAG